jgi:hypothetical protein
MVMPRLERITVLLMVLFSLLKASPLKPSMFKSTMMITGSQMRTSLFSSTTQIPTRNLLDKTPRHALPSLTMTSQVKFASRILRELRFHQPKKTAKLRLLERTVVMDESLLTMKPFSSATRNMSLRKENTSSNAEVNWSLRIKKQRRVCG